MVRFIFSLSTLMIVFAIIISFLYLIGEAIRKLFVKPVHIIMATYGDKAFRLRTIKQVRGLDQFHMLRGQIAVFQETTRILALRISLNELDEFFVKQRRYQSYINEFRQNLQEFVDYLQLVKYNQPEANYDEEYLLRIAKETFEKNQPLVQYFLREDSKLDKRNPI